MYMFSVHPLMLDGGSFSDLPLLQKCRWEFSFKAKRCLRWFFSLTSSRSLAEPKHPPFLRPRLIHLPMARTDLQNKQSFGDCSRIVGQMLNRCWLSLLRIQWTESGSIPQSLIYHNMCSHSNAPPLTVKAGDSLLLMYCHVRPSKALRLYLQRWTLHPRLTLRLLNMGHVGIQSETVLSWEMLLTCSNILRANARRHLDEDGCHCQ